EEREVRRALRVVCGRGEQAVNVRRLTTAWAYGGPSHHPGRCLNPTEHALKKVVGGGANHTRPDRMISGGSGGGADRNQNARTGQRKGTEGSPRGPSTRVQTPHSCAGTVRHCGEDPGGGVRVCDQVCHTLVGQAVRAREPGPCDAAVVRTINPTGGTGTVYVGRSHEDRLPPVQRSRNYVPDAKPCEDAG